MRPASDKQLSFLRSLLAQRPDVLASFGFATADDAIVQLRGNAAFTTTAASGMIDQLKGMPAAAAANGAPIRPNNHPGTCQRCRGRVAAGEGRIERNGAGKWLVFHLDGACSAAPADAPAPVEVGEGLYTDGAGVVWLVYTTQNGYLAGKRLTGRTFVYVRGGMREVRDAVARGALHVMTEAEATAFGRTHAWCVACTRDLTDDRSVAAGYGPVCARKYGWHYPDHDEAAAILGRPCSHDHEAPAVPACPACSAPLTDDNIGEPCYSATPDYRGLHPLHTATGIAPQV